MIHVDPGPKAISVYDSHATPGPKNKRRRVFRRNTLSPQTEKSFSSKFDSIKKSFFQRIFFKIRFRTILEDYRDLEESQVPF